MTPPSLEKQAEKPNAASRPSLGPRPWPLWLRVGRGFLATLFVLWALSEVVMPLVVDWLDLPEQVAAVLSEKTGGQVQMKGLGLHWIPWQGVRVTLDGVTLDGKAYSDSPSTLKHPVKHLKPLVRIASVSHLGVDVGYGQLFWGGKANIDRVGLSGLQVFLNKQQAWRGLKLAEDDTPPMVTMNPVRLTLNEVAVLDDQWLVPKQPTQLRLDNTSLFFKGWDLMLPAPPVNPADPNPDNGWLRLNVTTELLPWPSQGVSKAQKTENPWAKVTLSGGMQPRGLFTEMAQSRRQQSALPVPKLAMELAVHHLDMDALRTKGLLSAMALPASAESVLPQGQWEHLRLRVENGLRYPALRTQQGTQVSVWASLNEKSKLPAFQGGKSLPKVNVFASASAPYWCSEVDHLGWLPWRQAKVVLEKRLGQKAVGGSVSLTADAPEGIALQDLKQAQVQASRSGGAQKMPLTGVMSKIARLNATVQQVDLAQWQDLLAAVSPNPDDIKGLSGVVSANLTRDFTPAAKEPVRGQLTLNEFSWLRSANQNGQTYWAKGLNVHGVVSQTGYGLLAQASALLERPFEFTLNPKQLTAPEGASEALKATLDRMKQSGQSRLNWDNVALAKVCDVVRQPSVSATAHVLLGRPVDTRSLRCGGVFSSHLAWTSPAQWSATPRSATISTQLLPTQPQGTFSGAGLSVALNPTGHQVVPVLTHTRIDLGPASGAGVQAGTMQWRTQGQLLSGAFHSTGLILPEKQSLNGNVHWQHGSLSELQRALGGLLPVVGNAPLPVVVSGQLMMDAQGQYQWAGSQPQAQYQWTGQLSNAQIQPVNKGKHWVQQLQAKIQGRHDGQVSLNASGVAMAQRFQLTGARPNGGSAAQLALDLPQVNLQSLWAELRQEPSVAAMLASEHVPVHIQNVHGQGPVHLALVVPNNVITHPGLDNLQWQADAKLAQVKVDTDVLKSSLRVPSLHLNGSTSNGVHLLNTPFTVGDLSGQLAFHAKGSDYTLALDTPPLALSEIREVLDGLDWPTGGDALPKLWQVAGAVQLNALVKPRQAQVTVAFDKAGASWEGCEFPLYDLQGKVVLDQTGTLSSEGLKGRYANSPFDLAFKYNPHTGAVESKGKAEASPLLLTHTMIPRDMSQWLNVTLRADVALDGMVPKPEHWQDPKNHLNVELSTRVPTKLKLSGHTVDLFDLNTKLALKGDALWVERGHLELLESGALDFGGFIDHVVPQAGLDRRIELTLKTPEPIRLENLSERLKAEKGLEGLSQDIDWVDGLGGHIYSDLIWRKEALGEGEVSGQLKMESVSIPRWDLSELTLTALFDKQQGQFNVSRFAIPGADLAVSAKSDNVLMFPVHLEDVSVGGRSVNLTQLMQFTDGVFIPKIQNGVLLPILRPPKAWEPLFPVEFRDAALHFDELVYQNIILSKFSGKLTTFASGFVELRDVVFEAAGGNVKGSMALNPRNQNFFTLELYPENVKANALTRALLKQSNIIFGDVNGLIRFTTQGLTQEDMTKNANGVSQLTIKNGRLPQIARVETLLTGANILRGGIVGLNFNNLIRAMKPFDTNYFSELSGDFQIASGVLYTNNLISDGDNLDLTIEGWIRLLDGVANLQVTGAMSQDVSGVLGHIGKLSLGRLIRFIPGLGFMPQSRSGLIGLIPGVGFVPGFGGPAQDVNRFRIRVEGPLDDNSAIRNLEWLKD